MANTYYDSRLGDEEIEAALEAISGLIVPANNGKVIAINNGKFEARSVQWGGGEPTIEPLSVTANGTYTAPSGVDGYSPITVNVSGGSKSVTVVTSVTGGYNGGAVISIAIDGTTVFTATALDTYNQNYNKTSETVDVDGENVGILITPPATTTSKLGISISSSVDALNYQVSPDGQNTSYGYSFSDTSTLSMPQGSGAVVQPLSVTQNGTYNPPSGVDGYVPVTVNVPSSGGEGPIYYGASIPSPSLGNNEDLYIQYESKPSLYDYLYGIVAEYRKVNGDWIPYVKPVPITHGVHIWTHSTGGFDASMYIQEGYWDVPNNTFVPTGEIEDVLYTSVTSWNTAKNCYGLALLAYLSSWQIKASVTITDGNSIYQADTIVATWGYSQQKDVYLWTPSNT